MTSPHRPPQQPTPTTTKQQTAGSFKKLFSRKAKAPIATAAAISSLPPSSASSKKNTKEALAVGSALPLSSSSKKTTSATATATTTSRSNSGGTNRISKLGLLGGWATSSSTTQNNDTTAASGKNYTIYNKKGRRGSKSNTNAQSNSTAATNNNNKISIMDALPAMEQPSSGSSSEDVQVLASSYDNDRNFMHATTDQEQIANIRLAENNPNNKSIASSSPTRFPSQQLNNSNLLDVSERSPRRENLFQWQDNMEQEEERSVIHQKQLIKERDGFCRRVDKYDGSVLTVEGEACYELGNYLGGGVAGVVYEGHRLLPESEYPVRRGLDDDHPTPSVIDTSNNNDNLTNRVHSLLSCVPVTTMCHADNTNDAIANNHNNFGIVGGVDHNNIDAMVRDNGSMLTADSFLMGESMTMNNTHYANNTATGSGNSKAVNNMTTTHTDIIALEAMYDMVLIDGQDAPSRSVHMAKAVTAHTSKSNSNNDFPSDASFTNGFMEETVAIKILNPVGFRTLATDVTDKAVVAREGVALSADCVSGKSPMEERNVWWLINPSSRNLRTLQRYSVDVVAPRGVEVDRGSPDKGLRISLIAAYKDPATNKLRELPLTRCIEIWGHVPFQASDSEFRDVMSAIDKINQGLPPPAIELLPGRIGTGTSSMGSSLDGSVGGPSQMVSHRT